MNNSDVILNVIDEVWDCNCRNRVEKSVTVTATTQQIELQCNYVLNVISVGTSCFTVMIQNGIRNIIRNIYTNSPTQICIPDKCVKHLVTLNGQIIPK